MLQKPLPTRAEHNNNNKNNHYVSSKKLFSPKMILQLCWENLVSSWYLLPEVNYHAFYSYLAFLHSVFLFLWIGVNLSIEIWVWMSSLVLIRNYLFVRLYNVLNRLLLVLFTHVPSFACGWVSPFHGWVTGIILNSYDMATCPTLHASTPFMGPWGFWVVVHCRDVFEYLCNILCICEDRVWGSSDVFILRHEPWFGCGWFVCFCLSLTSIIVGISILCDTYVYSTSISSGAVLEGSVGVVY